MKIQDSLWKTEFKYSKTKFNFVEQNSKKFQTVFRGKIKGKFP